MDNFNNKIMMAHNPFNVMQVYCQQGEKKFMKQKKIAFQWCYLIENSENQYFICIFYYLLHLIYICIQGGSI